jgi:membrane protein YdbS with pleckstrin-like domain
MVTKINLQDSFIIFGVPVLLFSALIIFVKSSIFIPEIALFVTLDFLVVIPLIYYLLIRKKEVSKKSILIIILLGLFIASFILPKENQQFLSTLKLYVLPFVEVFLFVFLILKTRKIIKNLKDLKDNSLDFYEIIREICSDILPSGISTIFAAEISVIYYGLFSWKKRKLKENEFSYHKEGTVVSLILGFLLIVLVEVFVTHSMIKMGNKSSTIILTILSIYTLLQVISVLKSLAKRPVFIDVKKQQLKLKFGILSNAIIPLKNIKSIEISTKELSEKSSIKYFSPFGSAAGHNIIINLQEELRFESFYGFKKKATSLAVFIDDKNTFVRVLKNEIEIGD